MNQQLKYTVDIVLCIDSTGSMKPVIEEVKSKAIRFYEDLSNKMSLKSKVIDQLRVKVISFRDFFVDGEKSFVVSPFYSLPSEGYNFSDFINKIYAEGGGDEPESGLEALAVAIKSPWNTEGDRKRQVIVIWTDTSAHRLEKGVNAGIPNYPKNIPSNFDNLTESWSNQDFMNQNAKRLIIYAPSVYPWANINEHWDCTIYAPSLAGQGLSEIDYDAIINTIVNSIA